VEKALAKSPQDRYPDVATFIEALTGSPLQSLSGTAPVPSIAQAVPSSSGTARFAAPTPAAGVAEGGFAATHVPSGTVRFPAPGPAAADDVGFAATHMPSSTARIPAPAADDIGFAATLVPSSTARIPAPVAAPLPVSAAPVSPPQVVAPSPSTPELRRARAKPIIPLALGAVAVVLGVGVVNGWFGGRSAHVPASSAPESVAVPAPAPPVAPTPQPVPPPEAVPSAPVASPATPAAPVERKPTPKPASPVKREAIPVEVQADLDEAESALKAGRFQNAIDIARRSQRKQITEASYVLIARAYCRLGEIGNVKAQFRNLPGAKQREVRRYCKKYDMYF
jgi:serine/threonine-protein kinase